MSSITHAALAASVLVGMVSIPAASQTLDPQTTISGDIPNVSASDSSPRRAVTEVDEDSFSRVVETPFNKFSTLVKSGSVETTLENPNSRLKVEKSPSETVWSLETSQGTLEITEKPGSTVEKVKTPMGTLKVEVSNGETRKIFDGKDRESVEQTRTELLNLMERKKQEIQQRSRKMKRNALPEVEVVANKSTASGFGDSDQEFVELVNHERSTVELEGWKISDPSSKHEFGAVTLEPGERIRVYSGDVDAEVSETGIAWNDGGDTATLEDASGRKIDETSY